MNQIKQHASPASHQDVTLDELTALCELMVSLSKAGVPLDRGLSQLAHDLPGRLGNQAEEVSRKLQRGDSLAQVVASENSPFPPVYASVVEAGLRSGRTTLALEGFTRLARQLVELRKLVTSALVYPLTLLVVMAVVCLVVLRQLPAALDTFLSDHFLGERATPLLATLLTVYQMVADWFWLIPLVLVFLGIFWIVATRSATAAQPDRFADWVRWVPGAGRLLRNSRLLAFTDVLRLLVKQRVPLHEAVRLAGAASGDRDLREDAAQLAVALESGQIASVDSNRRRERGIPSFIRWSLCHTDRVGKLENTLDRARRMYHFRTEDSVAWVRTFLPVLFSFFLGGFVIIVYAALFLVPWYGVLRLISEPWGLFG